MNKTKFIEVPSYSEDYKKMQLFARSFQHTIVPSRGAKLFAFQRGDTTFGYADIVYLPIAFPAFHPELTSPRGVVEVVEGWRTHCQFATGGEGLIGVPTPELRQTFPQKQIENAGFLRINRELYSLDVT